MEKLAKTDSTLLNCDYKNTDYNAQYLHSVHNINLTNIASMQMC